MKYVLVSGGVVSGLGKGVTASSIGVILKHCGHRVTSIKIDPYLNTDAGTMSPFEHGEVFVLDDGGEVDLDLGNYERFLDVTLTRDNNLTTGKVYQGVIERERRGDYLGKTVQVVPHVTDAIQEWIERVAHIPVDGRDGPADVCVIELGGTVGDIESMPFIEALRQFQFKVGPGNFCCVHVSLVPVLGVVGEQKTKPTQHSVAVLRSLGLSPHLLACRSQEPLSDAVREKLALFCQVPANHVLNMFDVSNIWHVPLVLEAQGAHESVCNILRLGGSSNMNLTGWRTTLAERWDGLAVSLKIAMVGKYTGLSDAYLSVLKALQHACLAINRRLEVQWIEASDLEDPGKGHKSKAHEEAWARLKSADGILVPGGFGTRGVEGKVLAAHYARTANKPYLGICLGMQIAVIEFARNVLGLADANSAEFDAATPTPVVVFMPEGSTTHKGGTMRLGTRRTILETVDCVSAKLYQADRYVDERHRHRYEVNPTMVAALEERGLRFVGKDETGQRMEILELAGHVFYVASQFHPEFKSRPNRPSALFLGLLMEEELSTQGARDQRIAARRERVRKRWQALHGGAETPDGAAPGDAKAGQTHLQQLEQSRQRLARAREGAEQEATAVSLAGVRREDERRTLIESKKQALVGTLRTESRDSAGAVATLTAHWAQLMDIEVPQDLQQALQAQQAKCEVVLGRKGAIIEAARNILKAQDDEYVATLRAQAEDVDTLLTCMASQVAALDKQRATEATHMSSAYRQAHQSAARSSKAEMEALLEARSASEQAYIDRVIATSEESQNTLQEQRTADAEEFKVLKRRLEEQLHSLEAEAGIMRATYQVNTEKLVYNCRVLGERAQESAAVLSQQKRRLARQRDVLSGIKQRYAEAERRSAEENLRTTDEYRRTSSALTDLQDKFRRFQEADVAKRGAVCSLKTAELEALGRQLLDADRFVHERQLGWSWRPPQEPTSPRGAAAAQPALVRGQLVMAPESADAERRWDSLQRVDVQGQVVCEQLIHRELCLLMDSCKGSSALCA
ncbi:hypothetical protein WJX81_000361 [Elliptochloris bilobata]|uniref:CTP synthase n=1 Tax=Elliptochloris bilobata TaxID=381761 RepID=A0AAW1RN01_9CHLO